MLHTDDEEHADCDIQWRQWGMQVSEGNPGQYIRSGGARWGPLLFLICLMNAANEFNSPVTESDDVKCIFSFMSDEENTKYFTAFVF